MYSNFQFPLFLNIFLEPRSKCFKFLLNTFSVFHFPLLCSLSVCSEPIGQYAASSWIRPRPPLLQPLSCVAVSFIFPFQADWSPCCSLGTDFTFLPLCLCACSVLWGNIRSFSFLIHWNPSSNASFSLTPFISIQHNLFYLGIAIGIC